jgi:hypothetical protein
MSSAYPYFTPLDDPQFPGETPLPAPVGDADSGVSILKANADHTHLHEIGGETNSWQDVLFGAGWYNWAQSNRFCQYSRIGNVAFLRGVFGGPASGPIGSTMGTIPVDFCPKNGMNELFPAVTNAGFAGVSVRDNGNVVFQIGTANPQWVSFGTVMWSID